MVATSTRPHIDHGRRYRTSRIRGTAVCARKEGAEARYFTDSTSSLISSARSDVPRFRHCLRATMPICDHARVRAPRAYGNDQLALSIGPLLFRNSKNTDRILE